jgi:hypothetical protein
VKEFSKQESHTHCLFITMRVAAFVAIATSARVRLRQSPPLPSCRNRRTVSFISSLLTEWNDCTIWGGCSFWVHKRRTSYLRDGSIWITSHRFVCQFYSRASWAGRSQLRHLTYVWKSRFNRTMPNNLWQCLSKMKYEPWLSEWALKAMLVIWAVFTLPIVFSDFILF